MSQTKEEKIKKIGDIMKDGLLNILQEQNPSPTVSQSPSSTPSTASSPRSYESPSPTSLSEPYSLSNRISTMIDNEDHKLSDKYYTLLINQLKRKIDETNTIDENVLKKLRDYLQNNCPDKTVGKCKYLDDISNYYQTKKQHPSGGKRRKSMKRPKINIRLTKRHTKISKKNKTKKYPRLRQSSN